MKKKVLWFLAVFVMVVAMSIGMKGETQAATYISTPKNVSVYNPELDTIYLKWSKVAEQKDIMYIFPLKNITDTRL